MPTREDICSILDSYIEHLSAHDVDELGALFADDAVKHEPLGVASYHGRDEIRAFDVKAARAPFTAVRNSPITVSGRHAAMQVAVRLEGVGEFIATDLFEFDEQGKITSLSVLIDSEARP
ncbi:nuclear transport factor 2 family protein [Nocardioides alcanivorans]|uniref:nuclear transport factor 2 family protein n=1 Tax=Nocardioides alcanivorans TaxID=2897352 RepID=UPI001F3191D5|nr:nuclear transport factor 2 family protein [Nocardioides alcanivorans]